MLLISFLVMQVSVRPVTVVPGMHERFVVRVANPTDTAIVSVRVLVPPLVTILGVDAPLGWTGRIVRGTDTTPPVIEWQGDSLSRDDFHEFAFLGRVPGDARRAVLVFPVRVGRADGSVVEWAPGGVGPPGRIEIRGSVGITPGGAFVFAAGAFGLAALATALALRRPR